MNYSSLAYKLPHPVRRHVLHFESEIEDAVSEFAAKLKDGARVLDALEHVALGQFGQIEAGGKMLTVASEHHGADAVGQVGEKRLDARDGRIVERIALFGAGQPQHRDGAAPLGA